MGDDKPFACSVRGCGMQFTNEDHLTVHTRKHEMTLNLNLPASSNCTSFVDQTPTPTRFIKTIDEAGLFQDLHNPFDEQFKAAQNAAAGTITEPSTLAPRHTDDPLNTPLLSVTAENDLTVSTTSAVEPSDIISSESSPSPVHSNAHVPDDADTMPFVPSNQPSSTTSDVEDSGIVVTPVLPKVSTISTPASIKAKSNKIIANNLHTNVVQTPVITSVGASMITPPKTTASGVPTAVVVTRAVSSGLSPPVTQVSVVSGSGSPSSTSSTTAPVLQPAVTAPVFQLIIRLPDGQSMPVQIPVVTVAATPIIPSHTITTTPPAVTLTTNTTPSQASLTKLKLKEALAVNQKPISTSTVSEVDSVPPQTIQVVTAPNSLGRVTLNGLFSPPSTTVHTRSSGPGRRRRDADDNPDEKRRRFLERNRAAATRCRQKRKQWIQSLEYKAKELSATNNQLQNEVAMLRNEVAQLKTMLLAHKDCPITLQQRAASQPTEVSIPAVPPQAISPPAILPHDLNSDVAITSFAPTTVINASGEHITTAFPVTMDLVEVEVSSSQNSSSGDRNEAFSPNVD